jgi:hypothetical protein
MLARNSLSCVSAAKVRVWTHCRRIGEQRIGDKMSMTANRVVALCEQAAYFLSEDLSLIDGGDLKLQLFGADVTDEQAERMRANLARLQEIIDGCGGDCA